MCFCELVGRALSELKEKVVPAGVGGCGSRP